MKQILIIAILSSFVISENITIENEKDIWNMVGTFEINKKVGKNLTEIEIIRATIRKKNKKIKKDYLDNIKICYSKKVKNKWNTEVCSQKYKIGKQINYKDTIVLKNIELLIPIASIKKELNKYWLTVVIECGEKNKGQCYIHEKK